MYTKYLVTLLPLLAPIVAFDTEPVVATFTHYGSGDGWGSQNCANPPASNPLACGAGTTNVAGYTAAISQNDFGAGPGQGAGYACGECWTLTINADENGSPVTQKTINVTINNLCPIQGNSEWCSMTDNTTSTNQHGGRVHFDICSDNGGQQAFFTSTGAGKGTATQIECGSGTAAESSAVAPSSAAQSTSAATSAPAAASSYVGSSSSAAGSQSSSTPDSGSGSSGSGSSGSGSSGSGSSGSGSPYQASSSVAAAGASSSLAFPVPVGTPHHHYTPTPHRHATPTPGHHHPHFTPLPAGGRPTPGAGSPYSPPAGAGGKNQGSSDSGLPYDSPGSQSVSAAAVQASSPATGASGGEDECEEEQGGGKY